MLNNKRRYNLREELDNLNSEIKATQFFINMFGSPFGISGITPLHICYSQYNKLERLQLKRSRLISKLNPSSINEAI